MKKLFGIALFICISLPLSAQENTKEAYFHQLLGMEDSSGVTHLFYRLYQSYDEDCVYYDYSTRFEDLYNDHIYHFDTYSTKDSLFIRNSYTVNTGCYTSSYRSIDLEFFNNDPSQYYVYGIGTQVDPSAGLSSYSGEYIQLGFPGYNHIEIDSKDSVLVTGYGLISKVRSVKLPLNSETWQTILYNQPPDIDSLTYNHAIFYIDSINRDYYFFRHDSLFLSDSSADSMQFLLSDYTWGSMEEFTPDADLKHFYTMPRTNFKLANSSLVRMDKKENRFSSDTIKTAYSLNFTVDPLINGHLYISDSTSILFSENYGEDFTEIIQFETTITGLYKKPDSDILYVLTTEELLEINTETKQATSLKKLPVSNEPEPSEIPNQIRLEQNYPNPFNPSTVISYQLTGNSMVRLEVFDVTGRKVAVLVDGERKSAGSHQVTFEASGLSSGVYFYRLQTGGQTFTQKMMLVK